MVLCGSSLRRAVHEAQDGRAGGGRKVFAKTKQKNAFYKRKKCIFFFKGIFSALRTGINVLQYAIQSEKAESLQKRFARFDNKSVKNKCALRNREVHLMPLGISDICRSIAPSATLAMDAKAKELRASGVDIISFGAGEPDFDTPEKIREAMKAALDAGMTRYSPVPGTLELRDAILQKLKKENGLTYTRNEVIVSNGAKHSLHTIFQTIVNPGDEVVIPTPCWVSYPELVAMAGGIPVFVETTEAEGFVPSPEKLAAAVTEKTKAFMLTSPSNPNGCVWPLERLQVLADLAVARDFYIVSDEIYEKLIYDGVEHISIATLGEKVKARTLLVNGVSKTYAMTGFRVGYTAGPQEVISAMGNYQSQATSGANTPAQHAAAVALTMPQDCVEEMRKAFQSRRDQIVAGIRRIPGLGCAAPQGAFYVMMNIQGIFGKKYDNIEITNSEVFAGLLLTEAHVAVVPGSAFQAEGFCRLSYATSGEAIARGLERIEKLVAELR